MGGGANGGGWLTGESSLINSKWSLAKNLLGAYVWYCYKGYNNISYKAYNNISYKA